MEESPGTVYTIVDITLVDARRQFHVRSRVGLGDSSDTVKVEWESQNRHTQTSIAVFYHFLIFDIQIKLHRWVLFEQQE